MNEVRIPYNKAFLIPKADKPAQLRAATME